MSKINKQRLLKILAGGSALLTTLLACSEFQSSSDATTSDRFDLFDQYTDAKAAPEYLIAELDELCMPYHPAPADPANQPPAPPDNLWVRLRDGFRLDWNYDNQRVAVQLNWYKKHPSYLDRVSERADKYMHHIVDTLEDRNLPMELALLPIVESAFDPFAYSHGRAAGMWQFIPATGKTYGLRQDWWYDGRRDVVASTDAALDYLEKLNQRFDGNWLHALAAYNSGEGKVARAIKKNRAKGKPTDFWSLDLPKETRAYVPKLIALVKLYKEPEKYGISLPPISNEKHFEIVDVGGQIDLAQAAEMANISIDEIYLLNPGYSRWATSPKGPHRLLIPEAAADQFKTALADLPPDQRITWKRYKIKSGDSLIKIAQHYNTEPDVIRQINKIRGNGIRAGKTLLVPVASAPLSSYQLSADQRLSKIKNRRPGKHLDKTIYTVRKGDSFWEISRKFGVGVRQLAKWNGMAPKDPLRPGKKLTLWLPYVPSSVASNTILDRGPMIRKVGYRVRSGDSLARIADKFNVQISDITRWNDLSRKKYLQPGQALTLYVDVTNINVN